MSTTVTKQKTPLYVELLPKSPFYRLIDYARSNTEYQAPDEYTKGSGVAISMVTLLAKRMLKAFANVQVNERNGKYQILYSELQFEKNINVVVQRDDTVTDPAVQAAIQSVLPPPVPPPAPIGTLIPRDLLKLPTASKPKEVSQPAASVTPSNQRATEVVWAKAPELPLLQDKYSWFETPEYYEHLKKKVLGHRKHIRMTGPPGIGKSTSFEVLSIQQRTPLVNINADVGLRARQLIGGLTDLGRFEVAQFATAVIRGWWAKIDEVNGADADAILVLNSILAPPYQITINGLSYPVHPNFRLCVTYNPGLVGTKPVPQSFADRFYPFSIQFPNKILLKKMLRSNGVDVNRDDVEMLMLIGLKIAKERKARRVRYDITIRRLMDVWSDLQDNMSLADALHFGIVAGIDGEADRVEVNNIIVDALNKGQAVIEKEVATP